MAFKDLLGHVRSARAPEPGASCRCGAEAHAWHGGEWLRCQGSLVRVLSVDATRTAWRVAEVCRACAARTPRGKILPPAPGHTPALGDAEQHTAGAAGTTAPAFGAAMVTAKAPRVPRSPRAWDNWTNAVPRALECPVCAAEGVINQPPAEPEPQPEPQPEAQAATTPELAGQDKPLLTAPQGATARLVLDYLARMRLPDAQTRLLGLVITVRAARTGQANLTGQDARALKLPDAQAALEALAATGWVEGLERVRELLETEPSLPVTLHVPDLAAPDTLAMGKMTRTRVSGWVTRTLAAKPLRKAAPETKLAALWLACHAHPERPENLDEDALRALAGNSPDSAGAGEELNEILERLTTTGWITQDSAGSGYMVDPALNRYVPAAPTAGENHGSAASRAKDEQKAAVMELIGPAARYGYWAEEYWLLHGHGPSQEIFIRGNWPDAPPEIAEAALNKLGALQWLAGVRKPYALRPGARFQPLNEYLRSKTPQP